MKKLWFDTETGGLDTKVHSLLTAYFAVCDDNLNVIDELSLLLKPSDITKLNVTQQALNINKIKIEDHLANPETLTYEQGKDKLQAFFKKHKMKGKRRSLQPCGHNISFDKEVIFNQMISKEEFEQDVHYRTLDTSGVCAFLKDIKFLPDEVGSLTSLVEYYKIPMREAHTAKDDVLMNIEVYRAMAESLKSKKGDMVASSTPSTLLEIIEIK